MILSYGKVERVLFRMHFIAPDREGAFRSRLKHLRRLGFPPGVNTGPGRPAQYGVGELMRLVLVFQIAELGVPPERSAQLVEQCVIGLAQAARHVGPSLQSGRFDRSIEGAAWLRFDPHALRDLAEQDEGERREDVFTGWHIGPREQLDALEMRIAKVNLSTLIYRTAELLDEEAGIESPDFGDALLAWGDKQ